MIKETNVFLILLLVAGFVLFASVGAVSAQNFYVSTDGNDGNSGTLSSPFKTIDHGVDQCDGGDTVYVRDGTYTGGVSIDNDGTSSNYNKLINYNNENPVIKRSNIYDHGITIHASYWTIDGFEITNTWHPVTVGGGQHDIDMKNLECHYNGYSLLLNDGSYNILIEDCTFYDPHSRSTNFIGLRGEDDDVSHHISIIDCSFDGCGHNSINFYTAQPDENYEGTTDVLIEDCTFTNGKQVAIFTNWHGVTNMIVRDCHFDHYSRGIQAVMRDSLITDCTVEDHGYFFVYTQGDADSWNVTVKNIEAESGGWGSPSVCVDLKKGHDFKVHNIKAVGFSETSNPSQTKDPKNGDQDEEDDVDNQDDSNDEVTKEDMVKAINNYLIHKTITHEECVEIINQYHGV